MKYKFIPVLLVLLAAGCKDNKQPEDQVKTPVLTQVAVENTQVVLAPGGTAVLTFRVEEPGAAFNYDITSSLCQVELRIEGTTEQPEFFNIHTIAATEEEGRYQMQLKDNGTQLAYNQSIILCLITSRPGYGKTMLRSEAFQVLSLMAKAGISDFRFKKEHNPGLGADVPLTVSTTEETYKHSIEGNIPYWLDDLHLIASFSSGNPVYVNEVVQESGKTSNDFSKPVAYTVFTEEGYDLTYTVTVSHFTGLPVLIIQTESGKAVNTKTEWIDATLCIHGVGAFEDLPETTTKIRGRGNSTWMWPKKPFALKLDSKTSLLGMPKHKRWVLLANFMDRTLLRNRMALEMGRLTSLAWTPRNQFVEVILNGEHLGNYLLTEHIKVDKNRVNISDDGYLMELDFHYDNPVQWMSQYGRCVSMQEGIPFSVKFPDDDDITEIQITRIKEHIDLVASTLYGPDFLDAETGYKNYIDIRSFADYWIVFELCVNHELANPGSVYMHKDKESKLWAGPLWDFDWGTFSYNYSPQAQNGLFLTNAIWYKRLFEDSDFRAQVKERWNVLKTHFDLLPSFLEAEAKRLFLSAEFNFQLWDPSEDRHMNGGNIINGDENMTFTQAVERMKTLLTERIQILDEQINAL